MKHLFSLTLAAALVAPAAILVLPVTLETGLVIMLATSFAVLLQLDYRTRPAVRLPAMHYLQRRGRPVRTAVFLAPERLAA